MLPLSILDLVPQASDQTSSTAIAASVALAQHAEALGYHRIWYAEHHSLPGIASTAPDLMIAHVGARTSHIRLGAGGVMLPNHASLRIAEAYRLLASMYPNRIDLGLGRAPGTDGPTALALRGPAQVHRDDFPEQLAELEHWAEAHSGVVAQPDDTPLPPIWLLGSSDYSARLAAIRGYPFAYAAHFSPAPPEPMMLGYRQAFRAGRTPEPRAMLAVAAFVAETHEEAVDLARPALVAFVRLRTGRVAKPPTREEARRVHFTPVEAAVAAQVEATRFVGTPDAVASKIRAVAERCRADEVIVTTHMSDVAARLASAELLMRAWR
ncbi:MAG: LLM class flavin-dependent oxidoreductase [Myxococcota bacterium]